MKLFPKFLILILINFVKSEDDGIKKISIALVVDATKSMENEIAAVKDVCKKVLSQESEDSIVANYVLSVFRDPIVEPTINTTDPNEIANKLKDTVAGAPKNFDCAENSFKGIIEALKYTLPNSLVFVFTDDEAKDVHLKDDLLSQLRQQQTRVSFFLTKPKTKKCEISKLFSTYNRFSTYKEIAQETGGMTIPLSFADIEKVFKTFVLQFKQDYSVVDSIHNLSGKHTTNFTVDDNDKELIIQTTADTIIVYGPDGVERRPESFGENYKYLSITNPKAGTYKMDTDSEHNYSVLVGVISNIKFGYGFSVSETELKEKTQNQPIKGQKNYLTVFVSGTGELKQLDSVIITVGEEITKADLQKVNDKVYRTELMDFSQESFKMTVSGEDSADHRILRVL